MKIGIVGSSGNNGKKINFSMYHRMTRLALYNIKKLSNEQPVTLVSGGAALSDHIAVDLYLEGLVNHLILYFPCDWNEKKCQFSEVTTKTSRGDVAKLANRLHSSFSLHVGNKNSLKDIQMAIDKGAQVIVGDGFLGRNAILAQNVDAMIAFTFDKKMTPGTQYVWNECKLESESKIHLLIN